MGALETSVFIGRLMQIGPVAGLLLSKILSALLVALALKFRRSRLVVIVNYWFCAVVTWNLLMIVVSNWVVHE